MSGIRRSYFQKFSSFFYLYCAWSLVHKPQVTCRPGDQILCSGPQYFQHRHFFPSHTKMCISSSARNTKCHMVSVFWALIVCNLFHVTFPEPKFGECSFFFQIWRPLCLVTLRETTGCVPPVPWSFMTPDTVVVFGRSTIICWTRQMKHKNAFYQLIKFFLLLPAVLAL